MITLRFSPRAQHAVEIVPAKGGRFGIYLIDHRRRRIGTLSGVPGAWVARHGSFVVHARTRRMAVAALAATCRHPITQVP